MTKDREKAIKLYWKIAKERCPFHEEEIVNGFLEGFIDCAVYLLPQITELEKDYYADRPTEPYSDDDNPNDWANIAHYAEENFEKAFKRIAELEEKISILLSCKNCPENKGGLICQKEYENKCLAQKIQFIKELQEENAELKEKENTVHTLDILHKEAVRKYGEVNDQLTKAKELLNEFMRIGKASDEDFEHDYSELIEETEQFLSEVEK